MDLKSSTRTLASPWRQRSHWGLRVTKDAYFPLLTHTKQLLSVTFCNKSAGIRASFQTHRETVIQEIQKPWMDGQTNEKINVEVVIVRYLDYDELMFL